jgi:hypothetical protein
MKTRLLIMLTFIGMLNVNAQTTHNLDWFAGIGSNVDLTIETGDTVIWTWTSSNHTVENVPGSSVETFDSGFLAPSGSTFSHTFTVIGDNDYLCGIHGAASMSGTITVTENLGVGENELKLFNIVSNPVTDLLIVELPQILTNAKLSIHDLLGKTVFTQTVNETQTIDVNISNLNQGLYLISIESDNKKQTLRFIKK